MLYQLNYWPNLFAPGASPPDPLLAHSFDLAPLKNRLAKSHFVREARSLSLTRRGYLLSLCAVCLRQERQNLLISSRSDVLRRFFVVL